MNASLSNLSDSQLLDLCRDDASIDPNCPCLISGGGPEINTDISGPGVRISFYLQALCLGLTSARSISRGENTTSLYTLVSTNVAMVLTSFILGFKSEPGMSLHDAIVVFYLLGLAWVTIFFSMPTYNRFKRKDSLLPKFYVAHSYLIFALFFAVLIKAQTFGNTPRCNPHAVVVIFGDIPALSTGRFIAFALIGITTVTFSLLLYYDCKMNKVIRDLPNRARVAWSWIKAKSERAARTKDSTAARESPAADPAPAQQTQTSQALLLWRPIASRLGTTSSRATESDDHPSDEKEKQRKGSEKPRGRKHDEFYAKAMEDGLYLTGVDGRLVINLVIVTILWALFVMNSELLIKRNRFDGGGDGASPDLWGFGQILPLLVVVLPLVNLVSIFKRLGLGKPKRQKRMHRMAYTDVESGFGPGREFGNLPHEHAHGPGFGPQFRHDHGPRRPRPTRASDGHRTRADHMPQFFSHGFGQQSDAHISAESLHSNSPKLAEFAGASRADKGKGRADPRQRSTSSNSESDGGDESD